MEPKLRILHIEDQPADSELVQEKLRREGFEPEIHRVETLEEFSGALQEGGYALILSDSALPGMDVLEALRLTRQQHPEMPFIVLSGTLGEEQAIECLKLGATDYVLKQRLNRLVPAVRRALQEAQEYGRRQRAEAELRQANEAQAGQLVGSSRIIHDITHYKQAQQALRESEAKYRAIFEQAAIGIGRVRFSDARWIDVNDAFCRMLGYTPEFMRATPWPQITHPEDVELDLGPFQQMAAGELNSYSVEKRFIHQDGHLVWARLTLSLVRDAGGRPDYEIAIIENIEARKEAEAQLQRQAKLIDLSPTATIGRRLDGLITFWSAGARALYGWSAEEALGRGTHDLLRTEFSTPLEAIIAELRRNRGQWSGELRQRTRAGREVIVESHWQGQFTAEGQIAELLESNMDITARKQAEAALQRHSFHLQLLQQAAARLLVGQPPVALLSELHPRMAQAFGADVFMLYQAEPGNGRLQLQASAGVSEAERRQLETLRSGCAIGVKAAEELEPLVATHLQTREAPRGRVARQLGFRSYVYYPLVLNQRLHGAVAFASHTRDEYDRAELDFFQTIAGTLAEALERQRLETELQRHATELEHTVQERTAKLRETIAELEGFSYALIHDMRAPLRAMQSYASIVQEEAASRLRPEETDLLSKVTVATNRMDHLITDSLNYTRILRQELPLGPVNVGLLLRSMVETYPNLHPPQADVTSEVGDLFVQSNQAALTQVFSHLLDNAVKFVAPGVHPRVRVWAETAAVEGRSVGVSERQAAEPEHAPGSTLQAPTVRVFIQDNGIGISKEAQDKIFGMFQRLHREEQYPGTGIGLAIVRKSLERIGGQISVESQPGHGSRFCVQLPLPP